MAVVTAVARSSGSAAERRGSRRLAWPARRDRSGQRLTTDERNLNGMTVCEQGPHSGAPSLPAPLRQGMRVPTMVGTNLVSRNRMLRQPENRLQTWLWPESGRPRRRKMNRVAQGVRYRVSPPLDAQHDALLLHSRCRRPA